MARGQRARSRFERLSHHAYGQGASIAAHGAVESRPRVECGWMDGASGVKRSEVPKWGQHPFKSFNPFPTLMSYTTVGSRARPALVPGGSGYRS